MPVRQARPKMLGDAGSETLWLVWFQAYSEVHAQAGVRWTSSSPPKISPLVAAASGFAVMMGWPKVSKATVVGAPTSRAFSHMKRNSAHFLDSGACQLAPMIR